VYVVCESSVYLCMLIVHLAMFVHVCQKTSFKDICWHFYVNHRKVNEWPMWL